MHLTNVMVSECYSTEHPLSFREKEFQVFNEIWYALTAEIMDTCLFIGGDFGEENIRNITNQYITSNGIARFKKAHGVR